MSAAKLLPERRQVRAADRWDLTSLFASNGAWERAFTRWEKQIARYGPLRGTFSRSAAALARCLTFDAEFDRQGERLGTYAFLRTTTDLADSDCQRMLGRYRHVASRAAQATSFIRPEVMALPAATINRYLRARPLQPFRLQLERWLRHKPHTLSGGEERLLAMQTEMAQAAGQIFRQLHDADMKFGVVRDETGQHVELSNASFATLVRSPKRSVRKRTFHQYYAQYQDHENTLAATLAASIQRDVYYARARGYASARAAALFADNVPASVYDNLIHGVHAHLPDLHRYYDLRRRKMRLRKIHHYDTYVPILSARQVRYTWKQAVTLTLNALEPLGRSYCRVLEKGLTGPWCDRYPNRGKQSGAFSCGCYDGAPYILMNYDPKVLDHVFTLAHEAGHSMHSYYSARTQPYPYYRYTIFVAEVASTVNEQLLSRYLMAKAKTRQQRAYLINREIDAIRATIWRQTMFAEFEQTTHALTEAGEPLTTDRIKGLYGELLERYFGPDFAIDDALRLECFRIPHFYRAFYVYKYATGLAAAIALADLILQGDRQQRGAYRDFLKAGCAKFPLELLSDAGVDLSAPTSVDAALGHFAQLVDELEMLLD
jgi:oligoendopeptidase F